jgi:phosphatidylinositol glycan class V
LTNGTILDICINNFFSGLRRWDGIHFLHIARFGYIYETSLAFFPSYPLLFIRPLAYLLNKILIESTAYLLSSILINFSIGFLNTYLIYKLGLKYNLKPNHAYWSSILYIINPATIFFLAPYSETLFLFSQLLGHFYLQSNQIFYSCLCFAFGSTIRSNGIVSFGFILYYYLKQMYIRKKYFFPIHYFILCILPFFLTQYYQYREYCFAKDLPVELKTYGFDNQLPMPLSNFSSLWCLKRIPLSYQYVQKTYWNVGFLKYWTWKQIPNFLLAMPIFILIGNFIKNWFKIVRKDVWKYLFLNTMNEKINIWFLTNDFLPHIIYILFLSLFALLFMHIQVTTRFLFSSGPFLYFICADKIKQYDIRNRNLIKIFYLFKKETFLFYYYFIYVILGICLFSNFLPWT